MLTLFGREQVERFPMNENMLTVNEIMLTQEPDDIINLIHELELAQYDDRVYYSTINEIFETEPEPDYSTELITLNIKKNDHGKLQLIAHSEEYPLEEYPLDYTPLEELLTFSVNTKKYSIEEIAAVITSTVTSIIIDGTP